MNDYHQKESGKKAGFDSVLQGSIRHFVCLDRHFSGPWSLRPRGLLIIKNFREKSLWPTWSQAALPWARRMGPQRLGGLSQAGQCFFASTFQT